MNIVSLFDITLSGSRVWLFVKCIVNGVSVAAARRTISNFMI